MSKAIRRCPTASAVYADLIAEYPNFFSNLAKLRRGYLIEHGRALHNVRRITLCRIRTCAPNEAVSA
jgi:hypothetical protein